MILVTRSQFFKYKSFEMHLLSRKESYQEKGAVQFRKVALVGLRLILPTPWISFAKNSFNYKAKHLRCNVGADFRLID
jgi:hypothetical protein